MFQIGDIIQIYGDRTRVGVIVKEEKRTQLFFVKFFDPLYKDAWYCYDWFVKVT